MLARHARARVSAFVLLAYSFFNVNVIALHLFSVYRVLVGALYMYTVFRKKETPYSW